MEINQIYVISMDATNPAVQQRIQAKLDSCSFLQGTSFEIVQGYNSEESGLPEGYSVYDKWNVGKDHELGWNEWWTRPVLPGEIGCAIAHRLVWERIALEGLAGSSLILEDDFVCNGSLGSLMTPDGTNKWDIGILGRDKIEANEEEPSVDDTWVRPRHFYNMHAYILKNSMSANMLLSGGLKENIVPVDEYVSALGYPHRREDIRAMFAPKLNIVATNDPFYVAQERATRGHQPGMETIELPSEEITPTVNINEPYFEILDVSDWEAWKLKYVNLSMSKHEFELMVTDKKDNVFEFPLFTPKFCKEAIALAEAKDEWTMDRHEFYPTNDVLLKEIGLDDIYSRVIEEVVRPLAVNLWNLEGKTWDAFSNENFMARYTTNRQSHLSLHHDRSHLTMVIKLNDEFTGGGTWFPAYQKLSNPEEVGVAVLHPGMVTHRHGARPITMGKRYIIVSFIRSAEEP